jgi:hypothetical protein
MWEGASMRPHHARCFEGFEARAQAIIATRPGRRDAALIILSNQTTFGGSFVEKEHAMSTALVGKRH